MAAHSMTISIIMIHACVGFKMQDGFLKKKSLEQAPSLKDKYLGLRGI